MPTQLGQSKKAGFNFIMDRINKKLKGWKERFLSYAGRGVLISAVIQALPTYLMSCFLLPRTMCANIEKAMCKFWWGTTSSQRKIHWKARQDLFKNKFAGGLVSEICISLTKLCWLNGCGDFKLNLKLC
jgi:hypothetical protein